MSERKLPEALRRDFEAKLGDSLLELYSIWDDIGIIDEQRCERVNVVFYHLHDMLKEMLEEEKSMRNKMLARIDTYGEELLKLSKELNADKYQPKEGVTTLQLERDLRTQVESLNVIKHERLKQLKRLKSVEQKLCDNLCMTPYYIPTGAVPSEDQLKELNQHISTLSQEQEKRREKYTKTKKDILELMDELELEPSSSLERDLLSEDERTFVLSTENINRMMVLQTEFKALHKSNLTLASELRDRLDVLWSRLDIPCDDRAAFNAQCVGVKPSVIKVLRDKIGECELLKVQHLEKFITVVREELQSWWDRCYIPQTERDLCYVFKQEIMTEDLLDALDQEVLRVKSYYNENEALFQKLEKRQHMFQLYKDLEANANDPNRFNNRGGQLLQEEKKRKKLLKDLHKLEQELAEIITVWESEKKRDLLLEGVKFSQCIEKEWEEFRNQKENEKMERQKKQARLMEEEMIYGSKPVTPAKKRFTSTLSKTPNKFRKVQTPMNSTGRTPGCNTMSRTSHLSTLVVSSPATLPHKPHGHILQKTPRRLRDTVERRKSVQRRILIDRNSTIQPAPPGQSFSNTIVTRSQSPPGGAKNKVGQTLSTIAPPGTEFTYREFVQGINTDARSSILVLPSDAKDVYV